MSDSHDTYVTPSSDSTVASIAAIQTDVGNIKDTIKEIKDDNKIQGNVLNKLSSNFQQFGELTRLIEALNKKIQEDKVENEAWKRDSEKKTEQLILKIWIAYGAILLVSVLVVPIFVNVMSTYITNHLH